MEGGKDRKKLVKVDVLLFNSLSFPPSFFHIQYAWELRARTASPSVCGTFFCHSLFLVCMQCAHPCSSMAKEVPVVILLKVLLLSRGTLVSLATTTALCLLLMELL